MHNVTHMNDVLAQRIHRNRKRMRRRLYELNAVFLRVFDLKVLASVAPFGDACRHRDAMRFEVLSHRLGVGGVVCGVIESVLGVFLIRGQRQHFDELNGVEVIAHAGLVLRIGRFERTQIVHVEMFGLGRVGGVDAQVRYAGDLGASLPRGHATRNRRQGDERDRHSGFHHDGSSSVTRVLFANV